MAVLHEPRLDTVLMVEKAILDAEDYPTKMILWRSLPKKVQYQTFRRVLDYLEASGKIVFNSDTIIYVGADNEKLRTLMESSVRVR
jgi:S-adenosylmethionine:tRNA-ribosyltransferase-isomerase (queuine synthetase)